MAEDALVMIVADYIQKGKELPQSGSRKGRKYRTIRLPALQAIEAELYRTYKQSGIRKAELARRLGISKGNVEWLFDFNHKSGLDQLEAAFGAIGKRLSVNVDEAAYYRTSRTLLSTNLIF